MSNKTERTSEDVFRTIESGDFYSDYDQSVSDLKVLREKLTGVAAPKLKPLDLPTLLKHAFISGRHSQKGMGQTDGDAWIEYDPTENAAYRRILSALEGE